MSETCQNPFMTTVAAFGELSVDDPRFIGFKADLETTLQTNHALILGPEGCGKSIFLRTFFSPEYRKNQIDINRQLCFSANITEPEQLPKLQQYLYNKLCSHVRLWLPNDVHNGLLSHCKGSQIPFSDAILYLHEFAGYSCVMYMDNFEHFVCTPFTPEMKAHHDSLNSLIDSQGLRCVVATNYDLEKNAIPKDSIGSEFLKKFNTSVQITPFTSKQASTFVENKLANQRPSFTEKQIDWMLEETGGIPHLFEILCHFTYKALPKSENSPPTLSASRRSEIITAFDAEIKGIMDAWCGMFSEEHIQILKTFCTELHRLAAEFGTTPEKECAILQFRNADYNFDIENSVAQLCRRGILKKRKSKTNDSDTVLYALNCHAFQRYLLKNIDELTPLSRWEGKLTPAQKAALHQEAEAEKKMLEEEEHQKKLRELELAAAINKAEAAKNGENTTIHMTDNSTTINNSLHFSITPLLSLFSDGLTEDAFTTRLLDIPRQLKELNCTSEEEMEQALSEIGSNILPDVTDPEKQATIDEAFQTSRANLKLESTLPDKILDCLSPQCRFYVKSAVVVENYTIPILSLLNNDHSIQIVMYGKCLEQCMRDTLLHLFRTHEMFRNYDTYKGRDNPGHGTFGSMKDPSKAMLGSFCHMLKDCSQKLAALCVGNNMNIIIPDIINAPMSEHDWTNWWTNYASKLSKATKKRNMLHANPIPPSADDFAVLRSNTLGLDGLLFLSQVGKLLDETLFDSLPPSTCIGLPKQVYQPLIHTQQQIRWERIDTKHALCGTILCSDSQGHTLCGRITKKSIAVHHMENAQTLLNTTQQVQVGAYDSQNNWFTVTPL